MNQDYEPMSTSPPHLHSHRPFLPSFLTGGGEPHSLFSSSASKSKGGPLTPEKRREQSFNFNNSNPNLLLKNSELLNYSNMMEQENKGPVAKQGPPLSGFGPEDSISQTNLNSTSRVTQKHLSSSNDKGSPVPISNEYSDESSCWVTVFGFPPSYQSDIINYFGKCGTILKYKTNPGSNWIHFKYGNPIDARRALHKNSTVISGNVMVGVVYCDEKLAENGLQPGYLNVTPKEVHVNSSVENREKSGEYGTVRQLAHSNSYLSPVEGEVFRKIPQENLGYVSWAMEKIFGW